MTAAVRACLLAALCSLGLLGCSSSHPTAQLQTASSPPVRSATTSAPTTPAPTSATSTATTTTTATTTATTATTTTTTSSAASTATTSTTDTGTGTTSATATGIPDTSFSEASQSDPGAGPYPPGVSGERCTSTFLGFQGQLTDQSSDAAYGILTSGASCAAAGRLGVDYMKATGGSAASSSTQPASTTVDGDTCGSYWYRPAGDQDEPLPFITCEGSTGTVTVFGTGD